MTSPDEDPSLSASSGNDLVAAREEAYGPIGLARYVKRDGRALILYTHDGPDRDDSARSATSGDAPAHEGRERA